MALVRSAMYLCGFGGLGYCLMIVFSANETELNKKLLEGRSETKSELLQKRQNFLDVIKSASDAKEPLYRQKKEEIEQSLKK